MNPIRIAVIDDERSIRSGCQMALAGRDYEVDFFENGREGLRALLEQSYQVCLLDLKLPDIDGLEILNRVREKSLNTHFIVMTGYSTVQIAVEAMKRGAFDYLPKPFTEEELTLTVDRAIERMRLMDENRSLRQALASRAVNHDIVGEHPKMLQVLQQVRKVAPTDSTVLFCGESGTGKEVFARFVYAQSQRATRQFIAVDCSTFSPSLLESELFGHVKGAFTGAVVNKAGIFEVANGGTLFLDDIANLNLQTQAKLLRVLEMREYKPVGASEIKKTNMRVIAATNKDLKEMVTQGSFREDLYYRLNVFPVFLPALRERRDDIPKLAYHFLRLFCRKTGKRIEGFTEGALELLVNHSWPGNVRELKNVVERLFILADLDVLDSACLRDSLHPRSANAPCDRIPETLDELKVAKKHILETHFDRMERDFLTHALRVSDGNISRAAELVGMKRPNFHTLMRKHGLTAQAALASPLAELLAESC